MVKEFVSALADIEAEDNDGLVPMLDADDNEMRDGEGNVIMMEPHARFVLDGRLMRAFKPHPGQLTFMMANLGRGQTNDGRFAAIVNVMVESLEAEDKDHFESRLLTRDKTKRLSLKTVEGIFEDLVEQWFARPTQSPSDSAESQSNGGEN